MVNFEFNKTSQEKGSTIAEMAISIVVFMLIIISVIDLLRFAFVSVSIQHVLQESLESATKANFQAGTGLCPANNASVLVNPDPQIRASCIIDDLEIIAPRFNIAITNPDLYEVSVTNSSFAGDRCNAATSNNNAGGAGEIVAICIRANIPLFSFISFFADVEQDFLVFGRNEMFRFD